jgi:linoleoyl-CoA desaturase
LTGGVAIAGFFIAMGISGLALACVFQCAHQEEEAPILSKEEVDGDWFMHEMRTTVDFGHGSKLLSWFIGGLGYQIEHHLFRDYAHCHYRVIAPIVESTAKEYGIPYHRHRRFSSALKSHTKQLKRMGRM